MEVATIQLFQANDATDAYAIKLKGDGAATWRAQRGFGQTYDQVWSLELQSDGHPDWQNVDWDTVLDRVLEAYTLSDPVVTNFQWPALETSK
ncbi:MAG: hypothetical protein ACO1QB_07350 [Verrucomicrobiales bacterium]